MNEKTVNLLMALLLAGGNCAFAQEAGPVASDRWRSVFGSTHRAIAKAALKLIDKNVYPDLDRVSSILKSASSSESGHADIHDNGGKPREVWETGNKKNPGGVMGNYKALKPGDAYENLGVVCHLTQDMAVPTHAANVDHFMSDGFEAYAAFFGDVIGEVPVIDPSRAPYEYYQMMQDDTRSHLPGWVNPETKLPFWVASPQAVRFGEDVTFGPHGSYGGGKDMYTYWADKPGSYSGHAGTNNRTMYSRLPEVSAERLGAAVGYSKVVMESASRRLPPLVKDLSVYPNVVTPGTKVKLYFIALDNRTRNLKYSVLLTNSRGETAVLTEGTAAMDKPSGGLYPSQNSDGNTEDVPAENFLFSRGLKTNWDTRSLAEGTYTVEVQLTDEDGNTVPSDVNSDGIRENDTRAFLSVVNTIVEPPASSYSFDGGG